MKKLFYSLAIILLSLASHAQPFQNTFQRILQSNYSQASRVDIASDRGYIIAGSLKALNASNVWDALIMKTDFAGNIQFANRVEASVYTYFHDAVQTSDHGFVAAGTLEVSSGNNDVLIVKYDSCGNLLWQKQHGGSYMEAVNCISATNDGGFIITGMTATGATANDRNIMLLKLDASGGFQWVKMFGDAGAREVGLSVMQTNDQGYAIVGKDLSGTGRAVMIKTDAAGTIQWGYRYSIGANYGTAKGIKEFPAGGYALFYGAADSVGSFVGGRGQGILRLDASGNVIWCKMYKIEIDPFQQTGLDDGVITSDGGFAFVGNTAARTQTINQVEFSLMRTDSSGNPLWAKTYGQPGYSQCQGAGINAETAGKLRQTPDSGFVFGGQVFSRTLTFTILYLIKTDAVGRSGCFDYNIPISVSSQPVTKTSFSTSTPQIFTSGISAAISSPLSSGITSTYNTVCNTVYAPGAQVPMDSITSPGIYGPINLCSFSGTYNYAIPNLGPGYTYNWSVTGGSISSGQGSNSINVTYPNQGSKTINLTLTSPAPCSKITTLTLPVTVGNLALQTSSGSANCTPTGTASVSVTSGTGPFSYLWNNGATTANISGLSAGTYSVTVSASSGCTATASVTVTNVSGINVQITKVNTSCGINNGSADAGSSAGNGTLTFNWSNNATTSSISNLAAGTYSVTVKDATNCSATASVTIDASAPANPVTLTAAKDTICAQDSSQVCAPSGYSNYQWNTGETTRCVQAKFAGAYYLTVTDNGNCTASSNRINISVRPAPPVSVIVNGDTLSSYSAVSYQWIFNGSPIPGANSAVHVASQSGQYQVRITDANGCQATSSSVNITKTDMTEIYEAGIRVYPNPSIGGLWNMEIPNEMVGSEAEIYDSQGRLVWNSRLLGNSYHFESGLAAGIYVLRVYNRDTIINIRLFAL